MSLLSSTNPVLVSKDSATEIVASCWFNGLNVRIYDECTTTVHEYRGLSESAAVALADSLDSNSMADYRIASEVSGGSKTAGASWMVAPLAKGTKVKANTRRVGDSRMFTVVKATETHTCSNSANWPEY